MTWEEWEWFVKDHGQDVLIDGKTLVKDWPNCPTPDCPFKICIWAKENLCYKCTEVKIGSDEIYRRYCNTYDTTNTN